MKENICTIPINDVFEQKHGCPVCRIYSMLEEKYVSFIVGDAMMEPSVRVEVNKKGFCARHFKQMLKVGSRLPIALMLETHLDYINQNFLNSSVGKKKRLELEKLSQSCFVCDSIEKNLSLMLESLVENWRKEEQFRMLYSQQEYICPKHCAALLEKISANRRLKSSERKTLRDETLSLTRRHLASLKNDISHFCKMYDYRNRNGDFGNSKDSIERSIVFLTSDSEE